MKVFGLEIRRASKVETSRVTAWSYTGGRTILQSRSKPMLLSTVYRCVDLISDSVAVLPLKTYENPIRYIIYLIWSQMKT